MTISTVTGAFSTWPLVAWKTERDRVACGGAVLQPQGGGVLHLDGVRQRQRRDGAADVGHRADEPLQQVQRVDRLVHQHPAAGGGPATAPVPACVVGGVAEPVHGRPGAQDPPQPTAVEDLPQHPGRVVVAVLEADAEDRSAVLRGHGEALAVVEGVGDGLLQQHRDVAGEAFRREVGVPVVRGADMHDVRRPGVEHVREVAEARAAGVGGGLGATCLVDVADADRLDAALGARGRRVEDRVEMDRGDVAAADDGDPQPVRGHGRTPRGSVARAQS